MPSCMDDDGDKNANCPEGELIWKACTHSLELEVKHRQGANTSGFRGAFWKLRCGDMTDADDELFASRGEHRVGSAGFEAALYHVAAHVLEEDFNQDKFRALRLPVYRVKAKHTWGRAAQNADEQNAGGFTEELLFAAGAPVMFGKNLWTTAGLTNGAMGEFVQLVAPQATKPSLVALVRFPSIGPAFFQHDPTLVPVPASLRISEAALLR